MRSMIYEKTCVTKRFSLQSQDRDSKNKLLIILSPPFLLRHKKILINEPFSLYWHKKNAFVCLCVCVFVCAFKCVRSSVCVRERARERERERESERKRARERERHLHNRCMLFETGHPEWLKSSTWLASANEIDSFNSKKGSIFFKRASQNLT